MVMKKITPPASPYRRQFAPLWLATSVLVFNLAGCAGMGTPATPEAQVTQRAQARWDAQIAGDWKTAYSLTTPSYRAVRDFNFYRGSVGGAVGWKSAQVVGVKCEDSGQACSARVKMDYQVAARPGQSASQSTYFNESWVQEEGQWYFHPRR